MGKLLPYQALQQLISEWLKQGLEGGKSLSELQRESGITRQAIADIRDGRGTSDETIQRLAAVLKVDPPAVRAAGAITDPEGVATALRELAIGLSRLADRLAPEFSGDETELEPVGKRKSTETPKPGRKAQGQGGGNRIS